MKSRAIAIEIRIAKALGARKTPGTGWHGLGDCWLNGRPVSVKHTQTDRITIPLYSELAIAKAGGWRWYVVLVFGETAYLYEATCPPGFTTERKSFSVRYPPPETIEMEGLCLRLLRVFAI